MNKNIPAISIIIPMYNTEKYIGAALDSILNQTFQDFEVIVVDDASTDNSAKIVDEYALKFEKFLGGGGRLQLIRRKFNSGSPGTPRNDGLKFAIGDYIYFMDSDDALTKTALEELHAIAEKIPVDIIHCEKRYNAPGDIVTTDKNFLKAELLDRTEGVTEPTFMPENLAERVQELYTHKFIPFPWNNLFRRKFLIENDLKFPDLRCGEDLVFGFYVLCLAEKILRVPNVNYIYRIRPDSVTWEKMPAEKMIHRWTDSFFRGIEMMDEFMNQFELFNTNPEYRHMVFELTTHFHLCNVVPLYGQIPAGQLEGLIRRELAQVKDKTALTAFLFTQRNIFYLNLVKQQKIIQQLQARP